MKRISKDTAQRIASHIAELRELLESVEGTKNLLDEKLDEYNDQLSEVRSLVEQTAEEMQTYCDERSEQWQEGEAAELHYGWMSEWEGVDLDDLTIDEIDSATHAEDLETLPESVEG